MCLVGSNGSYSLKVLVGNQRFTLLLFVTYGVPRIVYNKDAETLITGDKKVNWEPVKVPS